MQSYPLCVIGRQLQKDQLIHNQEIDMDSTERIKQLEEQLINEKYDRQIQRYQFNQEMKKKDQEVRRLRVKLQVFQRDIGYGIERVEIERIENIQQNDNQTIKLQKDESPTIKQTVIIILSVLLSAVLIFMILSTKTQNQQKSLTKMKHISQHNENKILKIQFQYEKELQKLKDEKDKENRNILDDRNEYMDKLNECELKYVEQITEYKIRVKTCEQQSKIKKGWFCY